MWRRLSAIRCPFVARSGMHPHMSAFGVAGDRDKLRPAQRAEGKTVMTTSFDLEEEVLNWDVSDEALESAAGLEIAGAYTLQFCTSTDCALVS